MSQYVKPEYVNYSVKLLIISVRPAYNTIGLLLEYLYHKKVLRVSYSIVFIL